MATASERGLRFARWLENELDRHGWTQSEFANRLPGGESVHSKVSRWILGERIPSTEQCQVIATALDIHLDEVLAAAGHRPLDATPRIYEVIRTVRRAQRDMGRIADLLEERGSVDVTVVATIGTPPPDASPETEVRVLSEEVKGTERPFGVRVWMDVPEARLAAGAGVVCDSSLARIPRPGDLIVVRAVRDGEDVPRFALARQRGVDSWEPIETTDHEVLAHTMDPVVYGTFVTLAPLGRR